MSGTDLYQPLTVTLSDAGALTPGEATAHVKQALLDLVDATLSAGVVSSHHVFVVQNPVSGQFDRHSVSGISAGQPPLVATVAARAKVFHVKPLADGGIIAALRAYDSPPPPAGEDARKFWRSAARLQAAHDKAQEMANPSMVVSEYQVPKPFSFGGGPPEAERPLRVPVMGAIDDAARYLGGDYATRMHDATALANYTSHDPETLHPRFLNYVNERITAVDPTTTEVMDAAKLAQRTIWRNHGVTATARPIGEVTKEVIAELANKGSPGEYRVMGVTDRRDPRVIDLIHRSVSRFVGVGRRRVAGKRDPGWVATTMQPTLTFGKDEPKAGKYRRDGTIEPPIPRFIFNLSPVNYGTAIALHSDISKSLQDNDPTHGPGFGPGRGRSGKFLNVVEASFKGGYTVPDDEPMVMSDIEKWDAFIREVLIELGVDNLEDAVNKTNLDSEALAARAAMFGVSKRQLLHKLVEHPSGYLVDLYGAMPSGSYYTSLINTNCNNLLLLGHLIDRVAAETEYTVAGAAEEVALIAPPHLVSYGDNQLFSAKIFKHFGLTYSPALHAEFLGRFGMKLKVEETEVTTKLGRVRFCSRAVVRTPEGLMITRPHAAMYQKLAARPEHDPAIDKLYVRAIMADYMGTDPIAYEAMAMIDRQIDVAIDASVVTPKIRTVLKSTAKAFYGGDDDAVILQVLESLRAGSIDRRALLTLHTPRADMMRGESLGASLTVGGGFIGGTLTPAAEWAYAQTRSQWADYIRRTGQEGIYDN
uniref:RNA-dependent RNA polymerase n=1 Tax=Magnaporthe oryzae polymycovirus 2 TaxID=2838331 RepID=A0A8E6Z4U0_9VIRU|nr:RNA-dependent RNA polymerase [Magnaporthe oryzae polymycovirus 2]